MTSQLEHEKSNAGSPILLNFAGEIWTPSRPEKYMRKRKKLLDTINGTKQKKID